MTDKKKQKSFTKEFENLVHPSVMIHSIQTVNIEHKKAGNHTLEIRYRTKDYGEGYIILFLNDSPRITGLKKIVRDGKAQVKKIELSVEGAK